jgi:hypothetical protein
VASRWVAEVSGHRERRRDGVASGIVDSGGRFDRWLSVAGVIRHAARPAPAVTCSLPEEACPEVAWIGHIQWTTETSITIKSIEFRELPRRGEEVPFEPVWVAQVENWFERTAAAVCRSNPNGGLVCHYVAYGSDLENSPWYVPTPRERQFTWCRDACLFAAAQRFDIGQAPGSWGPGWTVFAQEYNDWQGPNHAPFTETLDQVCQAAYASR